MFSLDTVHFDTQNELLVLTPSIIVLPCLNAVNTTSIAQLGVWGYFAMAVAVIC